MLDAGTLDTADIVVVGGGIAGVTTALELRRRGFDVVIVEQRFLAFGASGRNPGALWVQLRRSGIELDLARRTLEKYSEIEQEFGATFELRREGGLFFYETDEQKSVLDHYVAERCAAGLDVQFISRSQALKQAAAVPRSALGAVFCAEDSQIDSSAFVHSLGSACLRMGVRTFENTAVLGTIRNGDSAVGVRTVRGDVRANGVVWANGAWSSGLRAEGVDLPVQTRRVGQLVTQPIAYKPGAILHGPRGVDACGALLDLPSYDPDVFAAPQTLRDNGATYDDTVAQNTEGALLIGNSIDGVGSLNPHISMFATQAMIETTLSRTEQFGELGVTGLWAGLVSHTQDDLPIVDCIDGLYVNTGHTHGIATAPAAAEALASLVAGDDTDLGDALGINRRGLQLARQGTDTAW